MAVTVGEGGDTSLPGLGNILPYLRNPGPYLSKLAENPSLLHLNHWSH